MAYHLILNGKKYGKIAVQNIKSMTKIKLKRKLFGDQSAQK